MTHDLRTLSSALIGVRVATAVQLTSIGRSRLYELIKSGEIEAVKVRRSTLIPYRCLKKLVRR